MAQSAEDQILSQVKEIVSAQNLALGISGEKRLHCNCIGIANQMGKEGKLHKKTLDFFLKFHFYSAKKLVGFVSALQHQLSPGINSLL